MSRGIDYSGPSGTVNRDTKTGIRYGIIPLHALAEHAYDEFDAQYDACCPTCGDELPDDTHEAYRINAHGRRIYGYECPSCSFVFPSEHAYGDEPSRVVLDDGSLNAMVDSSGDVWVFSSPYFTRAAFCSPCAPGACYLTSACDDGERAYCLGPDWFDGDAPYPIYSVETGERVK